MENIRLSAPAKYNYSTMDENKDLAVEVERSSSNFQLHAAAANGNVKEVRRLLLKEDPLVPDSQQRTPLHYASGFASQRRAMKMVNAILKRPLEQTTLDDAERKKRLLDSQDKNGETALHIAARIGHPAVVANLLAAGADANLRDRNNVEPMERILRNTPTAMRDVYDKAVFCKVGDPTDQNLLLTFDFGSIVGYPRSDRDLPAFQPETTLLSHSLQQSGQRRASILLHPVVQTFVHLKWNKIRLLFWMSILYHLIWLFLYTWFITDLYVTSCPYRRTISNGLSRNNPSPTLARNNVAMPDCNIGRGWSSLNTELVLLYIVTISVLLKELYEMYSTQPVSQYFTQVENLGQWLLIVVVGVTSVPVFTKNANGITSIQSWQYQASALGILLAWSLILQQIGKIPRLGIYIDILGQIVRDFSTFMLTFASLLIGFMISFQILMPEKTEFQHPFGFIKVMIMMIGELTYDDVFYGDDASQEVPFPTVTHLLYGLFAAIITIIMFNLLIGLAVNDILEGLQNMVTLSRISHQVEQINVMERLLLSNGLRGLLNCFNKSNWFRLFLVTQQTEDKATNLSVDVHITEIPMELQDAIRRLAVPNADQDTDDEDPNITGLNTSTSRENGNSNESQQELTTNQEDLIQIRRILSRLERNVKVFCLYTINVMKDNELTLPQKITSVEQTAKGPGHRKNRKRSLSKQSEGLFM